MSDDLTLQVHRGDGSALLAFNLDESFSEDLAGFAIECAPPVGDPYPLLNRLSFAQQITAETTPEEREWTPTGEAPIQKFHWAHYPDDVPPGEFTYRATAMLFKPGSQRELRAGPSAEVSLELRDEGYPRFNLGFTRSYVSSQAYAERYGKKSAVPSKPTLDDYGGEDEDRYRWLGAHARKLLFEVLDETVDDPALSLDVFAYDLDEPRLIARLAALGPRLRIFSDNSRTHETDSEGREPTEVTARRLLADSAGAANVKAGRFKRFAHDKILIQKRDGKPVKVLSGSANFSLRGFYVQANNVFVFEDPSTAELYERVFESAWQDEDNFGSSDLAASWFPPQPSSPGELPGFQVSFAPHDETEPFLGPIAAAIGAARSSVLFSIMNVDSGSGPVLRAIENLPTSEGLYAFGTVQSDAGLDVKSPGKDPVFIPFSYLKEKVPAQFRQEVAGGGGQVIHNKFVVVDFNQPGAVVYAGSSNLAAGGENENGDNLVAFHDTKVAGTYGVEAIRLIDHFRFRAVMKEATGEAPLRLKERDDHWSAEYFEAGSRKLSERELFVTRAW